MTKLLSLEYTTETQYDTLPPINTVTKDGIENKFHDVEVITSVKSEAVVALLKSMDCNFTKRWLLIALLKK